MSWRRRRRRRCWRRYLSWSVPCVCFLSRLSANYYGVAAAWGASARENAGNGRAVLAFLRQAIFTLAGAVSKVLDGLFHAQRYIGELIEVFGQVAGKALLLRSACCELFIARLRAGCGANAIDDGTHLARASFIIGLGMLGVVAADVVAYLKRVVAGLGKLPQGVVAQWLTVGSQCDSGAG